jgi:hypothetical protein
MKEEGIADIWDRGRSRSDRREDIDAYYAEDGRLRLKKDAPIHDDVAKLISCSLHSSESFAGKKGTIEVGKIGGDAGSCRRARTISAVSSVELMVEDLDLEVRRDESKDRL